MTISARAGRRQELPGRDLFDPAGEESFIPALIELDQPRLEDLAIVVREVGESGIQGGHVAVSGTGSPSVRHGVSE